MAKKPAKRGKHVPQRTCVGCRETLAKRSLIRVVRAADGVRVDPTGKVAGRGAYLHDRKSCWERGLKGPLAHALKTELTDQDRETLRAFMNTLPEDEAERIAETDSASEHGPGMAAPSGGAQDTQPAPLGEGTLAAAPGKRNKMSK